MLMKNFEKHIDTILSLTGKVDCEVYHLRTGCYGCNGICDGCFDDSKKWLLDDCKEPYRLSKLEYEILKRYKGYRVWIRIDPATKHRFLYANTLDGKIFACCDDAFCFMCTEDEYVVNEILSNCEVVENAD